MSELRPHLTPDFCDQAARYIMDHPGHVAITTGFYITMSGGPGNRRPPRCHCHRDALQSLGRRVTYVTDSYLGAALRDLTGGEAEVVEFPIADVETSRRVASEILDRLKPTCCYPSSAAAGPETTPT